MTRRSLHSWWSIRTTTSFPREARYGPAFGLLQKRITALRICCRSCLLRKAKLRVFYAMHHRYRPGDYETWKYIAPVQKAAWEHKSFEYGTWGGEIRSEFAPKPGEIVATEHWCSSG